MHQAMLNLYCLSIFPCIRLPGFHISLCNPTGSERQNTF
jgi:hypothetical protein